MENLVHRTENLMASIGGTALSGAIRLVAAVRPAPKPLHPEGDLVTGRLRRTGSDSGVPWLDQQGSDQVVVRLSRAIGLPKGLPDIYGLALRVPVGDGRHGDLLFATTGRGRLTRFLLTPGLTPYSRPLTTLMPYRTPTGPKVLGAVARDEHHYDLAYASLGGSWHPFAELVLSMTAGPDPLVSFDPILNTLPGLENYDWVRRLREPGYGTARHSR